jgi:hypothetical protein
MVYVKPAQTIIGADESMGQAKTFNVRHDIDTGDEKFADKESGETSYKSVAGDNIEASSVFPEKGQQIHEVIDLYDEDGDVEAAFGKTVFIDVHNDNDYSKLLMPQEVKSEQVLKLESEIDQLDFSENEISEIFVPPIDKGSVLIPSDYDLAGKIEDINSDFIQNLESEILKMADDFQSNRTNN